MVSAEDLLSSITGDGDVALFRELAWEGSFRDYLDLALANPPVVRNAFQRLYDMILSYGYEEYTEQKEKLVRYHFFSDPFDARRDAIFGLEKSLMRLVGHVKSAAAGYGTESRVLLLHGPVGSSKSTIVRLMKKGIEA
ncbi:MAG: serine protein kinase, partial [Planctomycetes bacterium]|nr:serine protein kinase [Planctomycetota bacterium]